MATRLLAMSDHATAFAARQPRVAIGASVLGCVIMIELIAAAAMNGLL